jgi:hypothetical protein
MYSLGCFPPSPAVTHPLHGHDLSTKGFATLNAPHMHPHGIYTSVSRGRTLLILYLQYC